MKLKQIYHKLFTMKKSKKLESTNNARTISANEHNMSAPSQETVDAFMAYWLECRVKGYHLTSDDFRSIQALIENPDQKCIALKTRSEETFKQLKEN